MFPRNRPEGIDYPSAKPCLIQPCLNTLTSPPGPTGMVGPSGPTGGPGPYGPPGPTGSSGVPGSLLTYTIASGTAVAPYTVDPSMSYTYTTFTYQKAYNLSLNLGVGPGVVILRVVFIDVNGIAIPDGNETGIINSANTRYFTYSYAPYTGYLTIIIPVQANDGTYLTNTLISGAQTLGPFVIYYYLG